MSEASSLFPGLDLNLGLDLSDLEAAVLAGEYDEGNQEDLDVNMEVGTGEEYTEGGYSEAYDEYQQPQLEDEAQQQDLPGTTVDGSAIHTDDAFTGSTAPDVVEGETVTRKRKADELEADDDVEMAGPTDDLSGDKHPRLDVPSGAQAILGEAEESAAAVEDEALPAAAPASAPILPPPAPVRPAPPKQAVRPRLPVAQVPIPRPPVAPLPQVVRKVPIPVARPAVPRYVPQSQAQRNMVSLNTSVSALESAAIAQEKTFSASDPPLEIPAETIASSVRDHYLSLLEKGALIKIIKGIIATHANNVNIFPNDIQKAIVDMEVASLMPKTKSQQQHYAAPSIRAPPITTVRYQIPAPVARAPPRAVGPPVLAGSAQASSSTQLANAAAPVAGPSLPRIILTTKQSEPHVLAETDGENLASEAAGDNLPSYEEMIVYALEAAEETYKKKHGELPDPFDAAAVGLPPKMIFAWITKRWQVIPNFRPSCSQALNKALKKGLLVKSKATYAINPDWDGRQSAARKPTRRPHVDGLHATVVPTPAPTELKTPGVNTLPIYYTDADGNTNVANALINNLNRSGNHRAVQMLKRLPLVQQQQAAGRPKKASNPGPSGPLPAHRRQLNTTAASRALAKQQAAAEAAAQSESLRAVLTEMAKAHGETQSLNSGETPNAETTELTEATTSALEELNNLMLMGTGNDEEDDEMESEGEGEGDGGKRASAPSRTPAAEDGEAVSITPAAEKSTAKVPEAAAAGTPPALVAEEEASASADQVSAPAAVATAALPSAE